MSFPGRVEEIDRAAFVHLGGVSVTYTPESAAVSPVTVTGIFDERYTFADQGNAGVEFIAPAVALRLEDLPTHPAEDNPTITIDGLDYTVRVREHDSLNALMRLGLRRAGL